MAKRVAALVAAWTVLLTGVADAQDSPQWPCEVTVSIEAGPWRHAAEGAVRQLDAATVVSWRLVEGDAMVTVGWGELRAPNAALASVTANDAAKIGGRVDIDPDVENRWVMYYLLHELAHVAGLDHNDQVSVLGEGDVPFRRFTAWDLDALGKVECSG